MFQDRSRTVELYHLRGNPHTSTMIVAYLPTERMLVQADAYNPPAPNQPPPPSFPFARNLVENVERLGYFAPGEVIFNTRTPKGKTGPRSSNMSAWPARC